MKKFLFLLLGFTIAVGASADVGNLRDFKPTKKQASAQTFQERFKPRVKTHNAPPTSTQASVSRQANVVKPKAFKGFTESDLAAKKEILRTAPYKAVTVAKAQNRTPVVIDTQPEGELVEYDHALSVFSFSDQEVITGTIKSYIVYAPDGQTVYIKNICGVYTSNSWVSGTINGNKITVPLDQYLYYSSYYGWYKKLAWGTTIRNESNEIVFFQDPNVTEITFTIDGNNIYLDNSSAGNYCEGAAGLAVVDEEGISYGLEWGSQYSAIITEITPDPITEQPEGEVKMYKRSGHGVKWWYNSELDNRWMMQVFEQTGYIKIVFDPDGETVYINNPVFGDRHFSWVRGTLQGGKIHVPLGQILTHCEDSIGEYDEILAWGTARAGDWSGFYFDQDATVTEATFTIDGDKISLDNSSGGDNGDGAVGLAILLTNSATVMEGLDWDTEFTLTDIPPLIYDQPDGNLVTYSRSGKYIRFNDYQVFDQAGWVSIVYAPDGQTVYIKHPTFGVDVSKLTWVKGTIANGKISVPLGQYIDEWYDDNGDYEQSKVLAWGSNNNGFAYDPTVTEVTYSIDGDNIVMDNSDGGDYGFGAVGLGAMWENSLYSYGMEWNTVFTPTDFPTVITEQPQGELVTLRRTACDIAYWNGKPITVNATVNLVFAPDGQTVYIQDPVAWYDAETWVRGTISGDKIHVPLGQHVDFNELDGGLVLAWGTSTRTPDDEQTCYKFTPDPTVTEYTYTIDGENITMDNSYAGNDGDGAIGLAVTYETLLPDVVPAFWMECSTAASPYVEPTVITEQPEGELVTYTRSGYTVAEGSVYNQEGSVDIVYAPDGQTVYIRDIVFFDDLGTWVRGTIENGKLHVPLGQYIYCGNGYNFFIGWGQSYLNSNNEWKLNYDPNVTEATYTIDGGTITLDNSSFGPDDGPDGATGLVIVVDVEPDYFFQCEVLTQFYTPTAITEQPEGELVQYVRHGNWIYESGSVEPLGGLMDVVFAPDGQTVYIKDPIYDSQNGTWVMGTLGDDNIINVPVGQILSTKGKYNTVLAWGKMALNTTTWIYDFTPDYSKATIQYGIYEDNIYMLDGQNEAPVYHGPAAMQDVSEYARGVEYEAYYTRHNGPSVITEQPAGDLVTYKRTGSAFYRNEELNKKGDRYIYAPEIKSQESDVNVVYAPDGQTVYLQDPVYCGFQYNRGTWVKGTLSDNNTKIHVPLGQYVSWDLNNETGDKLAWGSTSLTDFEGNGNLSLGFSPDFDMTEVTYTIDNGCIYLDNTQGGSYIDYSAMQALYYNGDIDRETFEQMVAPWLVTSGLVYLDNNDDWTGEINWGTVYVSKHPTTLPDPVVNGWYDYNNENGNNRLEVDVPDVDTEGLPIFNDALSYSIYTDYDKLFTFEASKYGLDEDVTEVTYDMWQNNWRLRPECVYFYRTNAEGFEPFFKWRIGIQLHYTVDGVKQSSGIVYLEVFEKPTEPEVPGDVNGDSEFNISDVTNYINYILNDGAEVFHDENADFNNDGEINITDVIDMINNILNNI